MAARLSFFLSAWLEGGTQCLTFQNTEIMIYVKVKIKFLVFSSLLMLFLSQGNEGGVGGWNLAYTKP